MKFTLAQPELIKKVQSVGSLAKPNAQVPLLSNVLISVNESELVFEATDLSSGLRLSLPYPEKAGELLCAISAGPLLEYLQALKPEAVELNFSDKALEVVQKGSRATLPLVKATDFPRFLTDTIEETAAFSMDNLSRAIRRAVLAASIDESRPILTGVLFKQSGDDNSLQVVGTDGYRLSISSLPYEGVWGRDLLIPAKPLTGILKGIEEAVCKIGFDKKNNQAWLSVPGRTMVVRLLAGDFPNFSKIIPTNFGTKVTIDKEDLLQAIKQVAVFARSSANVLTMEIGKTVIFSTEAGSSGGGRTEIEGQLEGDELTVIFNYRYLLDYVSSVSGGTITVIGNGPLAPVKFLASTEDGYTHIIMPVKP